MSNVLGDVRKARAGDFWLEDGYVLEKLVSGLTYTTNACVTPSGDVFVLEAGFSYPYVFLTPRLSRINADGSTETICEDFNGPAIGLLWHDGHFLVTHRGVLSRITLDGRREDLVTDLPALGDHHTNHLVERDGQIFFGQGTATNTGFVGPDNLIPFGWLATHPEVCDVPARDITLAGVNMHSRAAINPFGSAETGAYLPFGQASTAGQVIRGQTKANGVIYRCFIDGSDLTAHAWGLRNPYSVAFAPDGRLFCLEQGADVRGSRPLAALDTVWEVKEDAWYGFPDYLGGCSVPELATEQDWDGDARFVLAEHPDRELPYAQVPDVHAGAVQMDFAIGDAFGFPGQAFVACYGSAAPFTTGGKWIKTLQGVMRFDPQTRSWHDFYRNENPGLGGHGPERPTAVRFSPDGCEMLIVDYGITGTPMTGALWRVTRA